MNGVEGEIEETINEFVFRSKTAAAGASPRAAAFFLDLVPVLVVGRILFSAVSLLASAADIAPAAWERLLLGAASLAAAFWGWETVWCASRLQATPGKMAHGIRVVTLDKGIRLDFARASLRALHKLVPAAWIAARASALALVLHLLGAATRFSPGPLAARWLYPAVILLVAVVPSLPAWNSSAWRFNRQYVHDTRAGTLVRAPLRTPVRSIALQVGEFAAVVLLALAGVHRLAKDPPAPAVFFLRGEARETLARQFSRQFAKAPFRVASVRVRVPDGAFGGTLGAIFVATNFEGTVRLARKEATADIPFLASADSDGLFGRLDEAAGASRLLTAFLAERAAPEPEPSAPERDGGRGSVAAEKPRPVRPGGAATSKDWLHVRFIGAEAIPWPDDEPARTSPWLLAADFAIRNESSEPRFVTDWDAVCTVGGKPARTLWLESFDPLHGDLAPGATREGTILFALPRPPASASISWQGLQFETGPLDD